MRSTLLPGGPLGADRGEGGGGLWRKTGRPLGVGGKIKMKNGNGKIRQTYGGVDRVFAEERVDVGSNPGRPPVFGISGSQLVTLGLQKGSPGFPVLLIGQEMVFALEGEFRVELQHLLIWEARMSRVGVVVVVEEGRPTGVHECCCWLVMVMSKPARGRGEGVTRIVARKAGAGLK